jgi:hypothetical protein
MNGTDHAVLSVASTHYSSQFLLLAKVSKLQPPFLASVLILLMWSVRMLALA